MPPRVKPFAAILFALTALCPWAFAQPAQPGVTDSVFLIGDAGLRGAKDEVLAALRKEVANASAALGRGHVAVIFLGDNIYDKGLPDENGTPAFKSAFARLEAQVKSANVNPGVKVYFVPGNHDWDYQGNRGLARIRRQTLELRKLGRNIEMLPGNGCPGPAVRTAGHRLQILFLDTQWWLHAFARPKATDCAPGTEREVTAAIEKALSPAGGRLSIVVAHHPLISGGPHGNDRRPYTNAQDQDHDRNLYMRRAITRALEKTPPLAWVSGHEHTLEVLRGGGASYLLVSGAGNFGHTDTTFPDPARGKWLFPSRSWKPGGGYMRLDVPATGAPTVIVTTVDKRKARRTAFSRPLALP